MLCKKCSAELPDNAVYCHLCGRKQISEKRTRKRGNGEGSVFKLPNGKYKAVVTLGYYTDETGKRRRKTRSQVFTKSKDAAAALPRLQNEPVVEVKQKQNITFRELYDKWLPTHKAGKSTMNCYKAAMKHFESVWHMPMSEIDIDDLQDCLDTCEKGKRTQQNMKAMSGLVYKYGIPRNAIPQNLNLAAYLVVSGDGPAHRASFTDQQIELIRKAAKKIKYADYIYCLIYLGFRPSEFLALEISQYDDKNKCFTGGGKTVAGTNRIVTISPKILPHIKKIIGSRTEGAVFCDDNGGPFKLQDFTEDCFYPALEAIGIDNPMVDIGHGIKRHTYTPHSCRHTFSTLMKHVDAPSKDKLELIGHTSDEMLRYYQDVNLDDLRKITDAL